MMRIMMREKPTLWNTWENTQAVYNYPKTPHDSSQLSQRQLKAHADLNLLCLPYNIRDPYSLFRGVV